MGIKKCKTISLQKLIVTGTGYAKPLCDTCRCKDCDNPIEQKTVSIMGVAKKMKVYVLPYSVGIVVDCEGYVE